MLISRSCRAPGAWAAVSMDHGSTEGADSVDASRSCSSVASGSSRQSLDVVYGEAPQFVPYNPEDFYYLWCVRCLLITESPKTPGHYRYLILGPRLHPLYGIGGVQFAIFRVPVYTAISNFWRSVFSTLQSRSCMQLAHSCLLRGHEGSFLRKDILSFCYQFGIFSKWFGGF